MWFERLFKYPLQAYERGELVFTSGLDVQWWIACFALAALVVGASVAFSSRLARWSIIRRVPIYLLQIAAVALVLGLLAGPALKLTQLKPGANVVALLVDTSESMALDAGRDGGARLDVAKRLIADEIRPALEDRSEVAVFHFHNGVKRTDALDVLVADGPRTRLIEALSDLIGGYSASALAAVVVLSDGAENGNDGLDLSALVGNGVPVHTIGIGSVVNAGDVELADVLIPAAAPPNSQVDARLVIRHASTGQVRIRVRDGASVLATQNVFLNPASPVVTSDITLPSGATGLRDLTFEIESSVDDPLPRNDSQSRLLAVTERRYKVLYLEGEPRWEYKFIRRAAAEDEVIDLISWLRTTPRKTYRQGVTHPEQLADGFPISREALYEYHLVILGSLPATALSDEQHAWLESFIAQRGGSVLALAGRNALSDGGWDIKPLAGALPVVLMRTGFASYMSVEGKVRPTPQGLESPLTDIGGDGPRTQNWSTLPMLADHQVLGGLKPGATTLLEVLHEGVASPLLVEQPYGFGRSAVLATATTWRWRMRTPADDERHSQFWRQLLRYLAGAAQPRRKLSIEATEDELVVELALKDERFEPIGDATVSARITAPDGSAFETMLSRGEAPGVFMQTYVPPAPGIYRVDVTAQTNAATQTTTRIARVGDAHREHFAATLNRPLLERIADATGGRYWSVDDTAGLENAVTFGSAGIREQRVLALWDAPFLFLLLALLKCTEWSLRRWWGSV